MRRRFVAAFFAALGAITVASPAALASPGRETEYPVHAAGVSAPDDPLYGQQWGPALVRMPEAWAATTGSASTIIAVVDTGVDPSAPDLAGKVLSGADFVGDGQSGDPNGHGTFVARVAAARGDDGVGMAGYCWQCQILPVRVLDAKGDGNTGAVALGIYWAANHGANVINLSLQGDTTSPALDGAIAYAESKGIVVIAAAGNQTALGQDVTVPQYPAASPGVIGVAASDTHDALYSWSFRGPWTAIAAPGCIFTGISECGTSFASPAVAGIVGLALAVDPNASATRITNTLYATATAVTGGVIAHGRVDAAALLAALTPVPLTRVAGANRVATAVALAQRSYAHASSVIVARSDSYADALAAAPLAGKLGAPVLLTPSSALDPSVATEIQQLGATSAWLVGGETALSTDVESGLRAVGVTDLQRLAGTSRYDTAALIAQQVGGTSVYLASASGFADAVAVSGLAAYTKSPILLVDQDSVPAATAAALAALQPTTVTVIGGASVVSDAVVAALHATRVAGATRYATSQLVAAAAVAAGADGGRVWVATGSDWPDALAAGPAAAADGGVLVLADSAAVSVASWLGGVTPTEVVVVGGAASVSDTAFAMLQAALG